MLASQAAQIWYLGCAPVKGGILTSVVLMILYMGEKETFQVKLSGVNKKGNIRLFPLFLWFWFSG